MRAISGAWFLPSVGDNPHRAHHNIFVEPDYKAFWENLKRGQYQVAQYKRIGKDGKEVWIQGSYNPVLDKNGKPAKVIKIATDLTPQKAEYADLTGQINAINKSQAVIEFSLDGIILKVNENCLNSVGYVLSEVEGKHHSIFVESDYAKSREYQEFWDSLRSGKY